MDVKTEARSGMRLEGQSYQVGRDKMGNLVSTFFIRSLVTFSRQYPTVQTTTTEKKMYKMNLYISSWCN